MEQFEKLEIRQISQLKQPTIYYFLKESGISETHIKNLRKNPSAILLNGKTANTRAKIKCGDILEILKSPNPATQTNFCDGNLEVLFEDDDFLIVAKPHNLACTPTRSHYGMNLGGQICKYMQAKAPNFVLRIANRLDRETAGIVVVAKNVLVCNSLAKNKIEKEYHAIVQGNVYENITIDKPILTVNQNGINQMKRVISPCGKRAITHVKVVKNFENFCHVKLSLETGRTHQIRLHLSSIGHPLLGDTLYGDENEKSTTSVKQPCDILLCENANPNEFDNKAFKSVSSHESINPPFNNLTNAKEGYSKTFSPTLSCQEKHTMLILKKISFTHFRSGKRIALEIPFPTEWKNFV